ncbi:MAG: TatD family hydrolase [Verrucomicrobiota bacterium]
MLIDSHCHLGSHRFQESEIADLLARARARQVTQLLTLATSLSDAKTNLALAQAYPAVSSCLGLHPTEVTEVPEDAVDHLDRLFREAPHLVAAVGETGLDYYHPAPPGWSEPAYHARQQAFLRQHFVWAARVHRPLVLHTRDRQGDASFQDALALYREFASEVRAIFHCFPGPPENARAVLDLGGLVSFTGNLTFKKAHLIRETLLSLKPGEYLLETDSPYLAPVPHRGKRNEPAYVRDIAHFAAELLDRPWEQIAHETSQAARAFFHLP